MKTIIFWFSGTGNSLAAAKGLAKRIPGGELFPITRALEMPHTVPAETGDRIIIAFPLYYLSYPLLVRKFINEYPFPAGSALSLVITRGVRPMGGAIAECRRDLKRLGLRLSYARYLDMPNNDVVLFNASGEAEIRKKLAAVESALDGIARELLSGRRAFSFEPFGFMRRVRTRVYLREAAKAHGKYYASDDCTGCGICARLCPLGRISLREDRPVWSPGCQGCEACINYCPRRAIQYSGAGTEGKRRYRHPGIDWREIAAQRG